MSIKHLPGLTPDGQIYHDDEMDFDEALLPPGPWKTAHGPAMLETPRGTLLCCWFAGTYEGDTDINIVVSRLESGLDRWSEPTYISKDKEYSDQNPSLFLAPDDSIWAMYTSQIGRQPGKDNMQYTAVVKRQISYDDGLSWGAPEVMFPEPGTFSRQPIQVLSNGRWIYGNWICSDSVTGLSGDPSAFRISDNQGRTWKRIDVPQSSGRVHPNVVELTEGHLIAFMRSRRADWIYSSESKDWGDTWSVPKPTSLPNNNSSISAIKLQSGRIALAYNHSSAPSSYTNKGAWPGLRCPVSIALSEDGGQTFPVIRHIERGEGYAGDQNRFNNRQYEYPFLMQTCDGMLHVAYAYQTRRGVKWVTLSEQDVVGGSCTTKTYNPTSGDVGAH